MKLRGGIYAIVDVAPSDQAAASGVSIAAARVAAVTAELLSGGARVLQLRAKRSDDREILDLARAMRDLTRPFGAQLIIDDRADIALLADADGVHLGQADLPAAEVRRWFPPDRLIGVSCHSPEQAEAAVRDGAASYLGYGPVYATTSKERPDPVVGVRELEEVCRRFSPMPIVAIGGVTVARLEQLRASGAHGAAMISALLGSSDIVGATTAAARAFAP